MANKLKMHLILCIGITMLFSCKKNDIIQTETPPIITKPIIPTPPKDTTNVITPIPPPTAKVFELGTGSGSLSIDGKALGIPANAIIKIIGGTYNNIQISNFEHENGTVYIQNNGLIELVGEKQITFSNIKNVIFSGSGTPGIDKGFVFRDKSSASASIQLLKDINNFTISNIKFKNLSTYGAIQYESNKIYNGSESSYSKDLKFNDIECDNTGTLIRFKGSAENGSIVGLIKNIEISNISFKNAPNVGSIVVLENAQGYDIHNNTVQNINQNNNNHNGVFYIQGSGKFYNNHVRDHQGNAIRAWVYSIGSTPQTTLIFNNIVANSRQYGAFELQAFSRNMMPGLTTYSNAMVFNNTCGNLLPKGGTFPAQVLDLYGLYGGKCEVFNNVGYNFPLVANHNTNFIWNQLNDTKPTANNNTYFATYQKAGIIDDNKFSLSSGSPLKNNGASLNGKNLENLIGKAFGKDIYGNSRSLSSPSIGAVE